ncbi:reverse transcriptase domain-containing protein [Tanacetum coccineum]
MFKQLHINISLTDALVLIPKYQKMLKSILSNKEKLLELANTPLNENCLAVILKKLPEKLGNPGKFLIPYGFSELKCKALGYLGIARDVFFLVGKFTFPADFVIVDYESDPHVPLILGRPFLRTARALIDVHGEEMILCDGNERLILNMRHDTSSYTTQPHQESINMIDVYNISHEEILKDLVENQDDIHVKQLRTDNGTEFRISILVNFFDEKRISQNFSSPYTPEQNGVGERKNRTLIEAVRAMLSGSVFSKQYWTEAIATTCYTQNMSTIVKRHLKTLYEVFCERLPNINFFHVFGCPVYIHNHKDYLGKFDEKPMMIIFLDTHLFQKPSESSI